MLPCQAVGLVPAEMAVAAGVEVPVDLGGDEGGQELLGDLVVDGDAFALAMALIHPHGLEADRGGDELVRDLMVRAAAAVHGVISVAVVMMVVL